MGDPRRSLRPRRVGIQTRTVALGSLTVQSEGGWNIPRHLMFRGCSLCCAGAISASAVTEHLRALAACHTGSVFFACGRANKMTYAFHCTSCVWLPCSRTSCGQGHSSASGGEVVGCELTFLCRLLSSHANLTVSSLHITFRDSFAESTKSSRSAAVARLLNAGRAPPQSDGSFFQPRGLSRLKK